MTKARRTRRAVRTIRDLTPDPDNRRSHNPRNLGMITESLKAVGAARSIAIDEDDVVLAGNGVVAAAKAAGITRVRVIEAQGNEIIAVRRRGLSAEQKRALAMYDNRAAELAGWNIAQLKADLKSGLTLDPFFSKADLKAVFARPSGTVTTGKTDPDDVPSRRRTRIKAGDLFELGRHRLLCGDSTKAADVERLMGGERAGLMNTDPPYGISFDNAALGPTRKKYRAIKNDHQATGDALQAFLESAFKVAKATALVETAAWYLWHAFMGWVDGHQCPDYGLGNGERTQTTVWEVAGVTKADRDEFEHASPKPVELFNIPIVKHLRSGEACYEPFAGSGPQFIAAEQHGVRCFGIELEPTYCQVIIDRFEAFTGLKAAKV